MQKRSSAPLVEIKFAWQSESANKKTTTCERHLYIHKCSLLTAYLLTHERGVRLSLREEDPQSKIHYHVIDVWDPPLNISLPPHSYQFFQERRSFYPHENSNREILARTSRMPSPKQRKMAVVGSRSVGKLLIISWLAGMGSVHRCINVAP